MSEDQAPRHCYRERTNGVYFTRNAHAADCTDSECRGCKPCPEPNHCGASKNCSWHVAEGELTCGRCLASARRDLRWIVPLSSLLMPAAIGDGVDSEAANLAGPAVDPRDWTDRRIAMRAHLDAWQAVGRITEAQLLHAREAMEDDDEHHPARVLGIWAMMLTEDYSHDMPRAASLGWCAAYLDRTLHRVAQDDEQDFPLLARELRKCRQHIEVVLHNDDRPDQGAPCPICAEARREEAEAAKREGRKVEKKPLPRLQRVYAHFCEDPECERQFHPSVRIDPVTGEPMPDTSSDVWRCPRDRTHEWSHEDYDRWITERRATA